ncbi:hypothetical protein K3495_g7862 [Podosphaera aphanis]|nr:hypothetical protein K3495_g7862 [Podosphaera aphanis]
MAIAASGQGSLRAPKIDNSEEPKEPNLITLEGKHLVKKVDTEQSKPGFKDVQREHVYVDTSTIAPSISEEVIFMELEKKWILNLSIHYRDKSKREKFFVTFAETPTHWRRVTISVDYVEAPEGSLEEKLLRLHFQRDKIARIYEVIRESLPDIKFYDTVTNLKLRTKKDRLHVHVIEDCSEIISYPHVSTISHLNCRRIQEDELVFDTHISGFVYKVQFQGQSYIKKEIPGPDSIEEFLYEINALHKLSNSHHVIQIGGVVLDSKKEYVKGLLISFADKGALIDIIYEGDGQIPWPRRERWARQILQGLVDIHEAGFVQGDFTLSNVVIDAEDNAKIIDINRRGCPIGWEPPEVAALVASNQPISMYIGVKSDIYQLGMVLYALALQEDEPEKYRPFNLDNFPESVPIYFVNVCLCCLHDQPKFRSQASNLLSLFPKSEPSYTFSSAKTPEVGDTYYEEQIVMHSHKMNSPRAVSSQLRDSGWLSSYDSEITDISDDQDYFSSYGISQPPFPWRHKFYTDTPHRPEFWRSNNSQKSTVKSYSEVTQKNGTCQEPLLLTTASRPTTASFECPDLSGMDTVFEVPSEVENEFMIHTIHNDDEFVKVS